MTGTFAKLDYRLRPAKHAERSMLIDTFRRLRFRPASDYQYIGFGSIAFIDFRMVHKALGISHLISVEDVDHDDDKSRFEFNRPFDCIELRFGHSNVTLPAIDFSRHSIVWLDYDDLPNAGMLNDFRVIAADIPSGSFIGFTFTDDFPNERKMRDRRLTQLKDDFPDYVNGDAEWTEFVGAKFSRFVRAAFDAFLKTSLSDADDAKGIVANRRTARQVCFFRYKDGAPMATIGWVIVAENDEEVYASCGFETLPFLRTSSAPFIIKVPVLTSKEKVELEKRIPTIDPNDADLSWLPKEQIEAFASSYQYLPSFAPVETI